MREMGKESQTEGIKGMNRNKCDCNPDSYNTVCHTYSLPLKYKHAHYPLQTLEQVSALERDVSGRHSGSENLPLREQTTDCDDSRSQLSNAQNKLP